MSKESIFKTGMSAACVAALMIASEARSQTDRHTGELKFNSIEQYDNRSTVLQIKEKLVNEFNSKELREKTVRSIEASYLSAVRTMKDDEQLMEFIGLRRRILDVQHELKDSIDNQVELAGLIDKAMASGGLLPQVQTYLTEARAHLKSMGVAQDALKKRLAVFLTQLDKAIKNVPPPASYKTSNGTEFRLVSAGSNSFYISSQPVGENMTLGEAYKESLKLSESEGGVYRLPGLTELKILSQLNMTPSKAVWSSHIWSSDEPENARMSERFGVKLYMIWDPGNTFGRGVTFGELPFARYPNVAYYLVTSSKTGIQKRWNRVINSMK